VKRPLDRIFTSEECDIFYNHEYNILQTFWKGRYASGERLRFILNQIVLALEKTGASVIIADARQMYMINKEDQDWILSTWYPAAVKAGFRFQGLILDKNTYNELAIKNISQEYDKTIVTTRYFDSTTGALEWLKEIGVSKVLPEKK
jgi:hypothetical protein